MRDRVKKRAKNYLQKIFHVRFENRFISHDKWIEWFTARDFRASVICSLAKIERKKYQNA